jgi:hypothetical protein
VEKIIIIKEIVEEILFDEILNLGGLFYTLLCIIVPCLVCLSVCLSVCRLCCTRSNSEEIVTLKYLETLEYRYSKRNLKGEVFIFTFHCSYVAC